ncbi:ATP:ADP antiporter, AAA family [Arenibacter nanhaiticus]|uniref:ADP,ATP carrier protein n=1 Tax=Arenibacter nanhaiticus TaxID=558155 RepID=A0A1M6J4F1_9FLAO|nr:Npt1/Npt2 family nucleotide transporter [Arenibacter nanhaiticus]SHJ41600.1 ATP:ADP antiporter, AAA family [Arenibacter nanhaiticus]
MLRTVLTRLFDIREGEYKVSLWMQAYIFIIIATLLIIKPTVNALFLSELGVENLPFAFLWVALTAVISSYFYSKALRKFALNKIIETTLMVSIVLLLGLGVFLQLGARTNWVLYFFYVWVAIYAVLSASQFWVLANLVFNIREAKRLFGFIGSGAILGGIFGGYLTSLLAPIIGVENVIFVAAGLLMLTLPLLRNTWRNRVKKLNDFKQKKRSISPEERPIALIKKSKHLSYLAGIVGVSVLVAKLVDYLFSDFASSAIPDPDDLTSFFAFWFSTFNVLSLGIQLFFTQRVVGVFGVGFSLVLLPLGILISSSLFFVFPELAIVILIKAIDGTLKQSINKSAIELLSLPLPFELKNKTKSFIDVVVDSIATGIAGFILIFVIKGFELSTTYIVSIILILVGVWVYFVKKVRSEYFKTFRENLTLMTDKSGHKKLQVKPVSVIQGMKTVFESGTETQILFMLKKLLEINDKRFELEVQQLLSHPSDKVKTAAIKNMYFLNSNTMVTHIPALLKSEDEELVTETLAYLLLHSNKNSAVVFDSYLSDENMHISDAALLCLAREARDNYSLKQHYNLEGLIEKKISYLAAHPEDEFGLHMLLKTIGAANLPKFHSFLIKYFEHADAKVVRIAIEAAGATLNGMLIPHLLSFLPHKGYRESAILALHNYGRELLPQLRTMVADRKTTEAYHQYIPKVMEMFNSQEAVRNLFFLLEDKDLNMRLEALRSLNNLKRNTPRLKFNKFKVVAIILEECNMYHQTLSAMHAQIIIAYRNRKKSKIQVSAEEYDARSTLLDLLERRLDLGLERIFKLLGLKYQQGDVEIAYSGLLSERQEAQANAIEFLDNLLTGNLKRTLLPIVESTILDVTTDEGIQKIKHKIPSELDCFQMLMEAHDLKLKLAVLYLIKVQKDIRYLPLLEKLKDSEEVKIRTFAQEALLALGNVASPS